MLILILEAREIVGGNFCTWGTIRAEPLDKIVGSNNLVIIHMQSFILVLLLKLLNFTFPSFSKLLIKLTYASSTSHSNPF
jgi:hypothetical protein